ncbi:hypothetical protein SVAN01_07884 [Stagonosporopsis vannaccii]|nr:hypothetical protein SVAN01_07884 [Stagonosporopsis vannaccii]
MPTARPKYPSYADAVRNDNSPACYRHDHSCSCIFTKLTDPGAVGEDLVWHLLEPECPELLLVLAVRLNHVYRFCVGSDCSRCVLKTANEEVDEDRALYTDEHDYAVSYDHYHQSLRPSCFQVFGQFFVQSSAGHPPGSDRTEYRDHSSLRANPTPVVLQNLESNKERTRIFRLLISAH